jgi:hypothetical protein
MKTTDLFIEQVMIGFLVLTMCLLPVYPEIAQVSDQKAWGLKDLIFGVAAVGLAYLCGVVFDRYADACTKRFEKHLRARYALELAGLNTTAAPDPFPEDRYRIGQLQASEGINRWFNYLRSMIRLTRALSVFVPGVALASVMAISRSSATDVVLTWGYCIMAGTYLGLPIISASLGRLIWGSFNAPRTDQPRLLKSYAERRGLDRARAAKLLAPTLTRLFDFVWSPSALGATILITAAFVGAFTWAIPGKSISAVIAAAGGCAFAVLSAWAWREMQRTFMRYLHLFNKYACDAAEPVSALQSSSDAS